MIESKNRKEGAKYIISTDRKGVLQIEFQHFDKNKTITHNKRIKKEQFMWGKEETVHVWKKGKHAFWSK